MAKDKKDGKFQFVFLNLEGDDDTIKEAVRQAGIILNRGLAQPAPPKVMLAVPVQKALGNGDQLPVQQDLYELTSSNESDEVGEEVPQKSVDKPKRPRKAQPTPEILRDFNESDFSAFQRYVKQMDLPSHFTKYLAIATWFKREKETDEISISHIYTIYQLSTWLAPENMGQTFRDMKSRENYFENGEKPGLWKINIVGLNAFDKMRLKSTEE